MVGATWQDTDKYLATLHWHSPSPSVMEGDVSKSELHVESGWPWHLGSHHIQISISFFFLFHCEEFRLHQYANLDICDAYLTYRAQCWLGVQVTKAGCTYRGRLLKTIGFICCSPALDAHMYYLFYVPLDTLKWHNHQYTLWISY